MTGRLDLTTTCCILLLLLLCIVILYTYRDITMAFPSFVLNSGASDDEL
jgi:hypothetical protein